MKKTFFDFKRKKKLNFSFGISKKLVIFYKKQRFFYKKNDEELVKKLIFNDNFFTNSSVENPK